jgi:hypothetical protein
MQTPKMFVRSSGSVSIAPIAEFGVSAHGIIDTLWPQFDSSGSIAGLAGLTGLADAITTLPSDSFAIFFNKQAPEQVLLV